ncbi:hypothetical protein [Methanobrevibacter sp.]
MSKGKKEDSKNPYPLKEEGKVYIEKGDTKHKNLEDKTLDK